MIRYKRPGFIIAWLVTSTMLQLLAINPAAAQQNRSVLPADVLRLSPKINLAAVSSQPRQYLLWVKNLDDFANWLQKNKVPVVVTARHPDYTAIEISCTPDVFRIHIYPNPAVLYADIKAMPKEETSVESVDLALNGISEAHHRFPQVNGSGLVVSVKENRFDTADIDFRNRQRLTGSTSSSLSSHATSMATLIAGGGNSYYKGKGAAWAAILNSTTFINLLPEDDAFYIANQVLVQNHSYGTSIENYYGLDAAAHDKSSITNNGLLHVFSAGNSGLQAANSGIYANISGLSNLTGNFKQAKNIITVGATDSFGVVSPLSSKGPAYDGRVKPELVAMGEDGSSGAAALTSGAAMLLHHAFQQLNSGSKAPSALVKAALLTGAAEAGTPGVDFSTGFGQLNVIRSLQVLYQGTYGSGSLSQGQVNTIPITIPAGISQLRAMLVWHDPAANPNSAKALVNDLDLVLTGPAALEIQPWILSTAPNADSLRKAARRGTDTLNNAELITLQNPAPGNYQLKVTGSKVPSGPQQFFVAWRMDTANTLRWVYPLRNDAVVANAKNLLRWQTTVTTPFTIEYSYDGSNWQLIAANINPAAGSQYWQAPDTFAVALLRISSGAVTLLSDSIVISRLMNVQTGFNCADSFLYTWKPVGPGRYATWRLGSTYMEQTGQVNDTALVQAKAGNPVLHYAFAPLLNNGRSGIRSFTMNYTEQGVDCYFRSFLAYLTGTVVNLRTEIATPYRVKAVHIRNLTSNNQIIQSYTPGINGLLYETIDPAPKRGTNIYRAEVELIDGRRILSAAEQVFYNGAQGVLIFPNPARRGTLLSIVADELKAGTFMLYNSTGKKLLERKLTLSRELLSTNWLNAGTYFYRINYNDGSHDSGTIILQ